MRTSLTVALLCLATSWRLGATTFHWTNQASGGIYSAASNWSPNGVPSAADDVVFTNGGAYALAVDIEATNASSRFYGGTVTAAISGGVWRVTDAWRVGESSGATSRVVLATGLLTVTNDHGAGLLSVGSVGNGELTIRGGKVIADRLEAVNGSRSVLNLADGELITLRGVTINRGDKLFVGQVGTNPFVWRVLGGNNQIITEQFFYGGLTLGAGGRAVLYLDGPNTLLTVPGLDTSGASNQIHITGGATFQTKRVQHGSGSGSVNNLVVIAGPGSTWINDELMYLGMHAGSQTMILTNGGYFLSRGNLILMANSGTNHVVVTGSNSWFQANGIEIGRSLKNLILITNGGRFWGGSMAFGDARIVSGVPGTVLDVADGFFRVGILNFAVGTLRIGEAGSGVIIDELLTPSGTNAQIQTVGNFYVGHIGDLMNGDLRVGGSNASIASLNCDLRSGGWQLGASLGSAGQVTMTGGRATITNVSGSASVVVGDVGTGALRVNGGLLQADHLLIGGRGLLAVSGPMARAVAAELYVDTGGSVTVSNGALLQIRQCVASPGAISVRQATLGFDLPSPSLHDKAIVATDATISFRATDAAPVNLEDPAYLGRIQRAGRMTLQLVHATNAAVASLVFGGDAANWSQLFLGEGTPCVQANSIRLEPDATLAATNSIGTIRGNFVNHGQLILWDSTLRFEGPATLAATTRLQGRQGQLLFKGGLHLPASDIIVPAGISIQANHVTSEGGKLIIRGGGIVPNDDGSPLSALVVMEEGWVTYIDTPAVPLTMPPGLSGRIGLELIRSTNVPVDSQTFPIAGSYERLRLGNGASWNSDDLVISQGAGLFIADPSASVILRSKQFRVEAGGLFRDDASITNHLGFDSMSSNALTHVGGLGATWLTRKGFSVGQRGGQNNMQIDAEGRLLTDSINIGGNGANSNRLSLHEAECVATNGLTVAGFRNQFWVQTGSVFSTSQLLVSGISALVSLTGPAAVANCSTQVVMTGPQARLQIAGGASLLSSNLVLNTSQGASVEISDAGSLLQLDGKLTVEPAFFNSTNRVVVRNNGVLVAKSATLNGVSSVDRTALTIQSGQVWVTNATGNAFLQFNGDLQLHGGFLRANRVFGGNPSQSFFNFRAGRAEWSDCDLASRVPLHVGDGASLATLYLRGGTNTFRGGLVVSHHARLTGSGVILGAVTNRGMVWPSAISIRNQLVLDPTSTLLFSIAEAPGSPANSSLVVTGKVSLAGALEISTAPGVHFAREESFVLVRYGTTAASFANVAFGQRLLTTDRLASMRIDNTGSAIIATDFQSEDSDGDGIQDAWAMQYFGISPLLPGTNRDQLEGDWDADGLSNRDEFQLGTIPNVPWSTLQIELDLTAERTVNIHFPYDQNRSYSISSSENLLDWTETLIEDWRIDKDGLAMWTDTRQPPTPGAGRFYRLSVRPLAFPGP